ncbi:MAG: hypothetical protein AAFR13_09480, partial [Pseudomonadota bacterium]
MSKGWIMFSEPNGPAPAGVAEAKDGEFDVRKRNRTQGYVIACDGTYATAVADVHKDNGASDDYWTVGQMVSIQVGDVRIVGMLAESDTIGGNWEADGVNRLHLHIALIGEVV